jgi:hypothetical protein
MGLCYTLGDFMKRKRACRGKGFENIARIIPSRTWRCWGNFILGVEMAEMG